MAAFSDATELGAGFAGAWNAGGRGVPVREDAVNTESEAADDDLPPDSEFSNVAKTSSIDFNLPT